MKNLILSAALLINSALVFGDTNLCQNPTRNSIAPKATSSVEIHANLDSSANVFSTDAELQPYTHTTSMTVHGNNGNYFLLSFFLKKIEENKWNLSAKLINDIGESFEHINHPLSFNGEGIINGEKSIKIFSNELPITINMDNLTQFDNHFSVTCLSQNGWVSYEPRYYEDNKLIIPRLKVDTEYYYVNLTTAEDNSLKIDVIESGYYSNFEDTDNIPYFDNESNTVYIPSLVNEYNGKKYSVELHKNDNESYDAINVKEL